MRLTSAAETGKKVLVPLTNSLYVGGTLSDAEHVIVDIGTGFYVEKVIIDEKIKKIYELYDLTSQCKQDTKSAAQFYEGKIKDLTGSVQELEAIIQNKTSTLRVVEEGMFAPLMSTPHQAIRIVY